MSSEPDLYALFLLSRSIRSCALITGLTMLFLVLAYMASCCSRLSKERHYYMYKFLESMTWYICKYIQYNTIYIYINEECITKYQKLKTLFIIQKYMDTHKLCYQSFYFSKTHFTFRNKLKTSNIRKHKNESQLITICMKIDSIPDLQFATQLVIQHSWFYPVKCRSYSSLLTKFRNWLFLCI